jgi:hypothetical protein
MAVELRTNISHRCGVVQLHAGLGGLRYRNVCFGSAFPDASNGALEVRQLCHQAIRVGTRDVPGLLLSSRLVAAGAVAQADALCALFWSPIRESAGSNIDAGIASLVKMKNCRAKVLLVQMLNGLMLLATVLVVDWRYWRELNNTGRSSVLRLALF